MTGLRLWSNGVPLDDLGPVGDDLQIVTVFGDGGCGVDQITWSMGLPHGFAHPAVQKGALVEICRGPLVLGAVINDEPDVDAWKFTGRGLIHRAADFIAVNTAGTPTNNLKDAVTAAVANGLEWKIPSDVPNVLVSVDSVDQVLTVADLLNRYCAQTSQRWGITGSGWLRFYTDPSSVRYVLTPDAPSLASAAGQVSRLRVRYATAFDSDGNVATLGTVVVPPITAGQVGVVESFVDITGEQGGAALNEVQATTVGYDKLAQQAPQDRFTSGITPGPQQLTTIGDVPMDGGLWMVAFDVAEGVKVRSTGWRNPDVGVNGMGFDWIAGGATWSKSAGITINPLAMAANSFSDNMAEIRAGVKAAQSAATTALAVGTPDYLQSLITANSVTTMGAMPPTAALGDLCVIAGVAYVCTTPYTSGGSLDDNWTKATDPRTIALISATATAVFAADNANAAAATAQASADGKNTIHYNASAPTSSYPGVVGDTVFVFSGSFVSAQYKLTAVSGGTYTWTPVQITSAVIANLDAGKITTGILSAITISSVTITAANISGSTITSSTVDGSLSTSDGSVVINGSAEQIEFWSGSSLEGVLAGYPGGVALENSSGSAVAGLTMGGLDCTSVYVGSGGIFASGSDIEAGGRVYSNQAPQSALAGSSVFSSTPNALWTSDGAGGYYLVRTSASSREVKYDIEPAAIDDDLDALEQVGLFAYHYRGDPDARLMLGVLVEDMCVAGLQRYVDFEDDRPAQPSWYQINALLIAAHQRNTKRLNSLESRLAALEAS